jgi:membrane associated rhomboid family serine protease
MFLHDVTSPWHILFNMLGLWWAGTAIEQTWGTRKFLKFYFVCGVGAGLCVILAAMLFHGMGSSVIGASGAIYGLLLAFAMLFPDQIVIFIFFPIKAKYLVMILAGIALFSSVTDHSSGVSYAAHLGGLAIAFVYLRLPHLRFDGMSLNRRYEKWRIDRAKRKFQVYMRKQDSKREPWIH